MVLPSNELHDLALRDTRGDAVPLIDARGIVWGIGMALHEQAMFDPHHGRIMNADLADYHVPVNADVPAIDVILIPEDDPRINELGIKASERSRSAVWPRPSRTRFTTRRASDFAICRSRQPGCSSGPGFAGS